MRVSQSNTSTQSLGVVLGTRSRQLTAPGNVVLGGFEPFLGFFGAFLPYGRRAMTSRSTGSDGSSPKSPSTGIVLILQFGPPIFGRPNQRFAPAAKQVGDALANVAQLQASRVIILLLVPFGCRAFGGKRETLRDSRDPAKQSFWDLHRIEVIAPRVDGSQHVFANPAARIRQGFEHVRPSKKESALPFEHVARVQAEGWMFLLATARQLGVHSPGDRHGYFLAELTSAGVMLLRSPVAPILEPPKGARSLAGAFGAPFRPRTGHGSIVMVHDGAPHCTVWR